MCSIRVTFIDLFFLSKNKKKKKIGIINNREYETNIREMVQFLMNKGISKEKIVIISPPPVEEKAWEHSCNVRIINL